MTEAIVDKNRLAEAEVLLLEWARLDVDNENGERQGDRER